MQLKVKKDFLKCHSYLDKIPEFLTNTPSGNEHSDQYEHSFDKPENQFLNSVFIIIEITDFV